MNNSTARLTVLGCGTSTPHAERTASCYWLETNGYHLLLDAGADALHRAARAGIAWAEIDTIWISHFHIDHIGALPLILAGLKHTRATHERTKPLRIYGARGVRKLIERLDRANNYKLIEQRFPVEIIEVSPRAEFEILPRVVATTFSTAHTSESLALRLEIAAASDHSSARTSLVYTSDTGYTESLADFARDADLLIIECSYPYDKPIEKHLELKEAVEIARLARARRALLTHLYPECDAVDLQAEAAKLWDGETIVAHEFLRLPIK